MNKKRAFTGFGVAMLMVLAFAVFFVLNFKTVVVSGKSMEPTFKSGRKLLVSKAYWLVGPIRQKDIVVVSDENPDGYFIKRVYRLGGQVVDDPINFPRNHSITEASFPVPPNTLFVLGDNRDESEDSRAFGPISTDRVIGKVVSFQR